MQTHTMMNTTVISTAVSTTDTITAITILTVQLIPAGAADGDECGVELAGDVEAAEICALVGKACVEEWCIREGSMVVGDIVALFSGGDIVGETGRGVFVGKYVFVGDIIVLLKAGGDIVGVTRLLLVCSSVVFTVSSDWKCACSSCWKDGGVRDSRV